LNVQLPTEDLVLGRVGNNLLRRHACIVTDYLHGAVFCAGTSDAGFSVWVGETGHGGRGDEDWGADGVCQEGGSEGAVGYVEEDTGTEEDAMVRG
jgi:hypothetical protein